MARPAVTGAPHFDAGFGSGAVDAGSVPCDLYDVAPLTESQSFPAPVAYLR